MLSENNGRNPSAGGAMPEPRKGRVLIPILEQRRREIALAAFDIHERHFKAAQPKDGRLVDFAPIPKTQADGTAFKAKIDRKFFYSGGRMAYPK